MAGFLDRLRGVKDTLKDSGLVGLTKKGVQGGFQGAKTVGATAKGIGETALFGKTGAPVAPISPVAPTVVPTVAPAVAPATQAATPAVSPTVSGGAAGSMRKSGMADLAGKGTTTTVFPGGAGFTRPQLNENRALTEAELFSDPASGQADPVTAARAGAPESSVTLQNSDIASVQEQRKADQVNADNQTNRVANVAAAFGKAGVGPNVLQTSDKQQAARVAQQSRVGKTNQQLNEIDKQAAGFTKREQEANQNRRQLAGFKAAADVATAGAKNKEPSKPIQVPQFNEEGKQTGTKARSFDPNTGKFTDDDSGGGIESPAIRDLQKRIEENRAALAGGDTRGGFLGIATDRQKQMETDQAELARLQGTETPSGEAAPAQKQVATPQQVLNMKAELDTIPPTDSRYPQAKAIYEEQLRLSKQTTSS